MSNRETLTNYVYTLVNGLIQAGVQDVVVSPGSRSTPLAYAFASKSQELSLYRQVDERSAGFFALGIAKAKGRPVVLLCTSGTAAANYFPAIVEAKYARVPLIVITADRPHELREVGAPQTINQVHIYGENVKWSAEFPIPDDASQTLPYIEHHVVRAAAIAMASPMGPVHLNVPFREPLLINFNEEAGASKRYVQSFISPLAPSLAAMRQLEKIVASAERGLLVVGELSNGSDMAGLWTFIRAVKWPVLVESLSNLRTNIPKDCIPYIVSTYDAILKHDAFRYTVKVDTLIRFGAQPVSKFLMQFIAASEPSVYVVVDEDPMFRDSISKATHFIHANVGQWLASLQIESREQGDYLALWQQAETIATARVEAYPSWSTDEGAQVAAMLEAIPAGSDLFVSSSMPVRDIDTFLMKTDKDIRILANRGANGIDGVVSTALGYSAANPQRPMYLLIGDLALLHDSNAFIATRYQKCQLHVIVMNNDGGGIFSYLPQAKVTEHYEELFGTPTAITFEQLAGLYELEYSAVHDCTQLKEAMKRNKQLQLIEVFTNRVENTAAHRKLWQQIAEDLTAWLQSN